MDASNSNKDSDPDRELLATFFKNSIEQIRVCLTLYEGVFLIDTGVFYKDAEGYKPSKKGVAIRLADVANALGVALSTIYEWVGDLIAKSKAQRNNLIYKLYRLGWTQIEIAEKVGLTQGAISQELLEIPNLEKLIKKDLEGGKSVAEIAEYYLIDVPLTLSLILEGKDDVARLEYLNCPFIQSCQPCCRH